MKLISKKSSAIGLVFLILLVFVVIGVLLITLRSNNIDKYLDLGAKYLESQEYDKAIATYSEALEIDEMCVKAYLGLAEAYVGQGDIDKAIEILKEGLLQTQDKNIKEKLNELESNRTNSSAVYPITSDAKKLIDLLINADGVTIDGNVYTLSALKDMTEVDLVNLIKADYSQSSSSWYSTQYDGLNIYSYNEDDSQTILSCFTKGTHFYEAVLDNDNRNTSFSNVFFDGNNQAPDYLNAKDLFDFIEDNQLTTIDSFIQYITGEVPPSEKSIGINIDEMTWEYVETTDNIGIYFYGESDNGVSIAVFKHPYLDDNYITISYTINS